MLMQRLARSGALAAVLLAAGFLSAGAQETKFEPNAPIKMSPEIPADVDPALRDALLSHGEIMLAHRLFERQQWAAFIALNWPVDERYRPREKLGDPGDPAWTEWIESFEVFRPDGAEPAPWGSPTHTPPGPIQRPDANALTPLGTPPIDSRGARLLHNFSAIARVQVGDEVDQAFSFAVWDKNGNPAHYEILLNRPEYDFVKENGLFSAGGIAEFMRKNRGVLTFPAGRFAGNQIGAIELKLAWRILDPKTDDFSRYLTQPAYLPTRARGTKPTWTPVTVGLVGFHIAQKTETAPQWIWSTFEHVDNLETDALARVNAADGSKIPLKPSFNDPACQWCAVNTPAGPDAAGKRHTQIARLQPIPPETEALNAIVQDQLRKAGSKLAYYEMVGTQWPTMPALKPGEGPNGALANFSGGLPLPTYLSNAVMETFAQVGNTRHPDQEGDPQSGGKKIFVNGSCMGCHASSPYDFSWILTKAQPKPTAEPPLPAPTSP